ncbi:MAG: hypothetical protein WC244_03060 [Patescibacteria group bacterium]|jgi:hypothetical protein
MPKINLYRNISITFIVFTAMLLSAVFLFFYSQAVIIITPESQDVNLSFNLDVRSTTTPAELQSQDIISGLFLSKEIVGSSTFPVLSTKTASSSVVGTVKIVNNTNHSQALVKTTQLQAENGIIVRTNESVTVPGGGSVMVEVYPKDPDTFTAVDLGNLKIIKLATSLQDKIYGIVDSKLAKNSGEIKVLSQGDINRGQEELKQQLITQAKTELGLGEGEAVVATVDQVTTDKKIGQSSDSFNINLKLKVRYLQMDQAQLVELVNRKIQNSNMSGLKIGNIDMNNLKYTIINSDLDSANLKINYAMKATLTADNEILNKGNFTGKTIEEVKSYLSKTGMAKEVQINVSPYWKKTFPKKEDRIKVIVN